MIEKKDVYIVGLNISKGDAWIAAHHDGELVRAVQGVYFRVGADPAEMFNTYGIRFASHFFPHAALTHSTAWYRRPIMGRVFVGGEYAYKKVIARRSGDFQIIQSRVSPKFDDSRMYRQIRLEDPLGTYEVFCATEEMTLVHLMDATKINTEKHVPASEMDLMLDRLKEKYGDEVRAFEAIQEIAIAAGKLNEFDRLLRWRNRRRS